MRINLTDNNLGQPNAGLYQRNEVAALFPIADKTIAELCRENEHLLIFPFSIETSDDRIGESSVMSILNTNDPDMVRIATGNVMGFIGVGNLQIKIKSRFDDGRDDFLLHYMLQKVLSFNLFDLSHNNEQEDVFDFIMFMFPYFLKSAMRQGIYREYQNYRHNDAHLKGTIDIGRHIARNTPFVGKIAYSTREYSHDNNMTELIRHTIEFMKTKKYGQSVLNIDRETIENVKAIVEHTPLYNKSDRNSIVSKNLRMKTHPYYTAYCPLQTLCLQILRMEEVKYGENDDEICGILFDGAWLWEEYVNTILNKVGFTHPENKLRKGGIYLFEDHSGIRYPDFYKDDFVLDAKYKRLSSYDKVSKVDRDDVHQLIAYVNALHASRGGFIVPLEKKQEEVPTSQLKDSTSTLSIFGIEICKTALSYADFCEKMQAMEKAFIKSLKLYSMVNKRSIMKGELERFADKYIDFFENEFGRTRESNYLFFESNDFPEECRALGFKMDCGHSFNEAYGDAWNDVEALKAKISEITDIHIIGNGLFSQWRYFNHWSTPSYANDETKEWFLLLFKHLKHLCNI